MGCIKEDFTTLWTFKHLITVACISAMCVMYYSLHLVVTSRGNVRSVYRVQYSTTNECVAAGTNGRQLLISIQTQGRLGNQMCQYAAMMGIAVRNGFKAVYPEGDLDRIIHTFKMPHKPAAVSSSVVNQYKLFSPMGSYDNRTADLQHYMCDTWKKTVDIVLKGYFQSGDRYFDNIPQLIRSDFEPRYRHKRTVDEFIKHAMATSPSALKIGVHIRRGDFMRIPTFSKFVLPPSYYLTGIDYFVRRFGDNIVFFITCEDMNWAKTHIRSTNNDTIIYSPFKDYALDFTLLYSSDHVIISVGTFSWWVGWLTPGIKVAPHRVADDKTGQWIYLPPPHHNNSSWL